ncbi:MAG: TlpA family protein disulfide reductase [candidate division NC10 bacterium]|nr:TlpA family protein disulfide reductase [candidate division NC10 bacterium]
MKMYRGWMMLLATSLLLLGVFLVIVQGRAGKVASEIRPEQGYLAPDFVLPRLDGQTVRLSDLRGKAVLLNFWATWCSPCRQEMPTIEKVYQDSKSRGLEVLAVSLDAGSKSVVKSFMQELNLEFPVLLDPEMEVLRVYRMVGIPASFLIDKQGIIRHREVGYRDWTDPESRRLLEGILR